MDGEGGGAERVCPQDNLAVPREPGPAAETFCSGLDRDRRRDGDESAGYDSRRVGAFAIPSGCAAPSSAPSASRRNRCGGRRGQGERYFFFSILVMVSPDWVAVKVT